MCVEVVVALLLPFLPVPIFVDVINVAYIVSRAGATPNLRVTSLLHSFFAGGGSGGHVGASTLWCG